MKAPGIHDFRNAGTGAHIVTQAGKSSCVEEEVLVSICSNKEGQYLG